MIHNEIMSNEIHNEIISNEIRIKYGLNMIGELFKAGNNDFMEKCFDTSIDHLKHIFNSNNALILNKLTLLEAKEDSLSTEVSEYHAKVEVLELETTRLQDKNKELERVVRALPSF